MSLTLTNRLDKLENEIRLMIMLQKCGNQGVQGTKCTTKDGNNQNAETDTKNKGAKGENKQIPRCTPSKCSKQCLRSNSPKGSVGSHTPSKSKNPLEGCCCTSTKFIESAFTRAPPRESSCKCTRTPEQQLEYEKQRRSQLEEEVGILKLQIADMMQSKCMALNMTKQLKQRYEKMKGIHEDTASKLASLQRENEFLNRNLEREKMEKAKTESSVQVTKDMDKVALLRMRAQAAKIKHLNDSVMNLSRTVEDREFEKKRLEHEKNKIHEKLKKNKDITKQLSETNAKLAKSVKQKHDSFMAIRDKAGKYEKELTEYKGEMRRSQLELERLKSEIEKQKSKGDTLTATPRSRDGRSSSSRDGADDLLHEKLKKTKQKERRASETIQVLSQRLRDLEHKDPKAMEREVQRLNRELKTTQTKYDEAINKLKQCEEADKKRTALINSEMKAFADDLAEKEAIYLEEKEKMKALIEELQSIIDQQRKRIEELESVKQQQDIVIQSQTEQLKSKEEQIKLCERENDLVKEQCLDLDKQVDNLRTSIDEIEHIGAKSTHVELKERINTLNDQVDELKSTLRDEQAKSSMKDKVIDDQYKQLQEMKSKMVDKETSIVKLANMSRDSDLRARVSEEQVARMNRQLAKEKAVTKQTISHLTSMQKKKDKLEKDVEELEEAYDEISSGSVVGKFDKEQKQWDQEKKKLIEERDRAIGAAKLATKTLMETMDDFQGQIKSQQKLQKIVTEIIGTKSNSKIPPCVKHREIERLRQMQVAIPCKPTLPCCNLRCNFLNNEDYRYNSDESDKCSCPSDSDDTSGGISGIMNFLGQYSNLPRTSKAPCAPPSLQQNYQLPSISRPLSEPQPSIQCRCGNFQCQCQRPVSSAPNPCKGHRYQYNAR